MRLLRRVGRPLLVRHRRRIGWRGRLVRAALAVVLVAAGLTAAGAGYVASVPLPADPVRPQASTLYYSDGRTILARIGVTDRTDVPLSRIPLPVRRAVLAAEDRDFYHEGGVSFRGTARALWADLTGGSLQGGSTITQQYVRNAYLTLDQTVSRKTKEIALAIKVEQRYSKDQILDRYLNTIYFGRGAYGIEAASVAYFGVTVDRLDTAQGMVLASVIKDPTNFDPAVDRTAARQRWRWVRAGMVAQHWLSAPAAAALRYPETVAPQRRAALSAGAVGPIVDQVERELARDGISAQQLRTGGLSVVTTIDRQAQHAAVAAVHRSLRGQSPKLRAALVAVDPDNGAVRAYYGGDDGPGYYDEAAAPRPPAGSFTPFTLAAALDSGISPYSTWDGSSPRTFPDRDGAPLYNVGNVQCPHCDLTDAMVRSLNTPYYALAEKVGPARVAELAHRAGVSREYYGAPTLVDGKTEPRPGRTRGVISMGHYPVSPADLASAYATLADGGVATNRHLVATVRTGGGKLAYRTAVTRHRVYTASTADAVTRVLVDVALDVAGFSTGHLAAGKPGTQQWGSTRDNQAAWMAGYTDDLATSVWLGRDIPGPIRDAKHRPITGQGMAATLWSHFLYAASAGRPDTGLPFGGGAEALMKAPSRFTVGSIAPPSPTPGD